MSEQKTALITGATDGIGKATAKKLLSEGWRVVIVGRNPQKCAATVEELKNAAPQGEISAITADLTRMSDVKAACETFLAQHSRLDVLLLNANAIQLNHVITPEGFEQNLAVGFFSRALMARKLETVLKATPDSQILSVIGLNTVHLNYDDLTFSKNYSSRDALGGWQWATLVFSQQFNQVSPVPMNVYMPGLVDTKILDSEPWWETTPDKMTVEDSAENIFAVLTDTVQNKRRDGYYRVREFMSYPTVNMTPDDPRKLWDAADQLLQPYL